MRVSWPILAAGLLVAAVSLAMGEWLTLGAVVVVVAGLQWWRPSWARREPRMEVAPTIAAPELATLYRWRRVLVPMTGIAVLVNGWAYLQVITQGTHYGTSLLTTLVGFVFAVWALKTQRCIERLEDALQL